MDNQGFRTCVFAVALVAGSACHDSEPDEPTTDAGSIPTPDGDVPLDLGGDGPRVLELTCPALVMPAVAGTVFVDATAASGGDGSKAAPFATIAQAFASAGQGGVIYVAAGTYKDSLAIPDKDLALYGGFAPGFAARTDGCATILEAPDRSQTVLVATDAKSFGLDGVTVQKGARGLFVQADAEVDPMYTIASSVFVDNGTVDDVGGGALLDNASAKISRSVFRDNHAAKGAAIALGGEGGTTISVEASLFERNIGHSDHGGALYLSPTTGTILRSTFRGNEIGRDTGYGGWGGAVVVFKSSVFPASLDFAYNVFTDNLAGVGAAVFIDDGATATMSHDLLYRNRAIRENGIARGAAIYVDGLGDTGSRLVADHLTVANNNYGEDGLVSPSRGGDVFLETFSSATFTNSVFWNNGSEALFGDPTCSISVSYSIAASACAGTTDCTIGTGVFEPATIEFVDEAADDYHEKSTAGHFSKGTFVNDDVSSPAIDKADPAASSASEPAPNGTRANLGAFGQTTEASKSP